MAKQRKRKPRPLPGYTFSHFLLDRCFVAVTEPHRIKEHEDAMLPRVDPVAQRAAVREGKRRAARRK